MEVGQSAKLNNKASFDKTPQTTSEPSGVRGWGSIDVYDKEGNKVSSFGTVKEAYQAGVLGSATMPGLLDKVPVYKSGDKFTTIEPADASVELDKNTGKITVTAPSYVLEDPEFQGTLDMFKTYSGNYKVNPKAEYTQKNSDGTTESVTLEQYIDRLNTPVETGQKDQNGNPIKISPFQSDVNSYIYANSVREFLAPSYKQIDTEGNITPVNLTRSDIVRMSQNGLGADVNDSTRIAIPKGFSQFEKLYADETWDEVNSTTTVGKLKEIWHNREKTDKQEILTTFGELGRYLANSRRYPTNAEDVDTEKWTATYALYTYLAETDPTCSLFRGAWDVMGSVVNASGHAAANFFVLGAEALSGVAEKITDLTMNLVEHGLSQDPWVDREDTDFTSFSKTVQEVLDTKFWAQSYGYGIGDFEKAYAEKAQQESDQAQLKNLMGIGVDEATAARLRTEGATLSMNSKATSIQRVGTTLIQLGVAIHIGNVLEGAAKGALGKTAGALLKSSESITEMVNAGMKAWVPIMGAKGISKVFNMVAKCAMSPVAMGTIGLVGESIGEAIFQSPEVLTEILRSDDMEPEAKQYLWDTFMGNAYALVGVTTVGKGLKAVGDTAWGKGVSRNMQTFVWKKQAQIADLFDGVRIKLSGSADTIEWLDKIGSKGLTDAGKSRYAQKEAIMAQQRTLRRARQMVAENSPRVKVLGESAESILKQIDEADDAINTFMKYENALDDIARGNTYRKLTMAEDNPLFDSANQNLQKVAGDLADLQTKAGLKAADKVGGLRLFAPEVSEYINARFRIDIGNSAIAAKQASKAVNATEGIDVIQKEVAHWKEVVVNFEKNYAGLVPKANEYIAASREWWQQFNTMRANMGLISELDIAKWREEGIWGENGELYVRQQRKAEQSDYVIRRRDGRVERKLERDMGHYNWGSEEEFVDPMIVAQQEYELAAEQANRIQAERTYSQITGTATVKKSAEDVRVAKEARPYLKAYNNEANAAMKPLVNEMQTDGIFNKMISERQISDEATTTKRQLTQIDRQIKRPVTRGEAQIAVLNLDSEGIEQLWTDTYGAKTIEEITGEVESATNSKRMVLGRSKEARESAYMREVIIPAREQQIHQTIDYAYLSEADRVLEAQGEIAKEEISNAVDEVMDEFKTTFFANGSNAHKVADEIAIRYGGEYPDAVKEYLYYDALRANKANLAKQVKAKAKSYFEKYEVEAGGKTTRPYKAKADYLANRISKQVSAQVDVEFNASRATLSSMGGDASRLLDHDSWQREIYETANEISDLKMANNIVAIPNASGETELVEVDPLLAIFVNSATQYTPMGLMGRANYLWMRMFRLGTTGLNPSSWVNQYYRDLGNAWVMGNVTQTLGGAVEELSQIFSADAGYYLAQYSQEAQENLLKLANEQQKGIAQVMAEREIRRGQLYAGASSESAMTRLWRGTKNQWITGGQKRSGWDKSMDAIDKLEEKVTWPNEVREKYCRNLTYGNNFAAAIKGGKSIEQARTFAEYISSNATANFTRGVAFMSQFQNTIPYFRSAINGARSFYRLWSLDPVGVTGRIVGGIVLPAFALTMMSLSTEENRQTYKKIQAYQKEDSLPIVMDGEAFFIPLPQELSAFVAPFRQAAESINGLGYNNALEVTMNDLLALSPVDFGGFTDIDSWRIYGEGPDWTERLTRGGAQLFSQIMPKWAVSLATAASGRDLYTGNKIDTSYVTVDPDTGEQRVMSYSAGVIATQLNKIFPSLPAPIAQEMLENIFGTAGSQLMDFLTNLLGQTVTGNFDYASAAGAFAEDVLKDIAKPMSPYIEARESADWRHTMSDLWDMKNDILSPNTPQGQAWQAMLTNKRNATTQTERDAVATARANILDPFYAQVMGAVNKLIQANPSAYTPYKLGSVMSLLNFGSVGDTVNSAASEAASDIYNQSKYAAIETMVKIGFPNVNQPNILGTMKVSQNGSSYIQWNTPLQILDMENTIYAQGAIYAADIKNRLSKNGIDNAARSQAFDAYYAEKDKAKKQKIAIEWDTKVATAIAPYVQQYGAEAISNSNDVIDLLDGYLIIPNDYTKYRGKSTYNPKVNVSRGYSKQFIKDIFGAKK